MGRVALIGAGTMGAGIAQICAVAGNDVALFDVDSATLAKAFASTEFSLGKFVSKGRLTQAYADDALARIVPADSITTAAMGADIVIEAVVERLDVKQAILAEAKEATGPNTIFGTNTSQLSVTAIGSALGAASNRIVGMHFFNPPALMPLVELVAGLDTSDETLAWAEAFATGLGKETVICRKDSPGFLTSRISAIVRLECLRMLEEELASPADIDKALKLGLNFPMGPLELGDFNGLDTYLHALEGLERSFGERYRPTTTLKNLVAAGRLGRKTGHGIYRYDEAGKRVEEDRDA
ncbi:3-hydroxyacyl-CoA dehydrogenase family protein [Ilumatobacter sp.]|uniref:3-hydroxyacyl-CoA dehydrogenase family protein n=1 Tax=Ilumatobacter sp. TaxID=1967498 RepID=UPI003750442C